LTISSYEENISRCTTERGAQSRIASSIHHELRSICRFWYREVREFAVHGELEFSEGTSAKWIFDVEIEKLGAEKKLHTEKTNIMLVRQEKILISPTHKRTKGRRTTGGGRRNCY
jgi:hypothetical protein